MSRRRAWLFVHGLDPAKWARRFGIEPFAYPCSLCGALLTTSLPFLVGALRGLVAPPCACGNELTPYAVVTDPRQGDARTVPRAPARERR